MNRRPRRDYDDEQRAAFRDGYLEGRAWQLGTDHGTSGGEPFGDLDAGGEALLMDALGETGWTTEDNHPLRVRLIATGAAGYLAVTPVSQDRPGVPFDPASGQFETL